MDECDTKTTTQYQRGLDDIESEIGELEEDLDIQLGFEWFSAEEPYGHTTYDGARFDW